MKPIRASTLQLAILVALALLLTAAGAAGWLQRIGQAGLDQLLRIDADTRTLPADIVFIDIDQKSLEQMNALAGSWPWPRAVHGELTALLAQQMPRAIVFDILFNEADTYRPDSDAFFAQVIQATPQAYLPTMLLNDGTGAPLAAYPPGMKIVRGAAADADARAPILVPLVVPPDAWRGGLINFTADDDGTGRNYLLYRDLAGWQVPSLPRRLAEDNGWALPDSAYMRLRWYGSVATRYSYADVYADLTSGQPALGATFTGKTIIIGTAAPGLHDLRPTPLSSTYPGALVLATAIANLQQGDWLEQGRWGLVLYPLLLLALLLSFRAQLGPLRIGAGLAAISALLVVLQYQLLHRHGVLFHAFAPVLAAWLLFLALALASWWLERQQRLAAVSMFGRFLDPRVVRQLVDGGAVAEASHAHARQLSVLFSDIRGFTSISENRRPEQVVALLNDYFSRQVKVIFATQGTLDKFIGDAIMAFWGAPADDPDHARHAVEAALQMVDVLLEFRRELAASGEGPADFDVGIGVHTGDAVVGFIGSQDRLDYTVIGDTVNLSSRIEGSTKGVARILVSETTMQACGDAFDFIDHGIVHVKGREQGVRLYEPVRKTAGSDAAGAAGQRDGAGR